MDVKSGEREKYIEKAALKTVAAFLNSEGGSLLIGVSDNKEVIGVESELKKFYRTQDKFLLHFKNLIKSGIGPEFYDFIDYKLVDVNGHMILLVRCDPSESPCWFEGKEFSSERTLPQIGLKALR